jgi:predicted TIM-barrel fold metal-dependent hydrolase
LEERRGAVVAVEMESPGGVEIIDPLHHFFDAGAPVEYYVPGAWATTVGQPYLVPEFLVDLATTPRVTKTIYVQAYSRYREDGPVELRPVGETEWVEQLTREYRDRIAAGIVGYADLVLGRDVEPVLEAHREAGRGRFVGIRMSVMWDADATALSRPDQERRKDLLKEDSLVDGLRLMGEMGLVYETTIRVPQLAELATVAHECAGVSIVVDHTGGFTYAGRFGQDREQTNAEWRAGMELLAACPNVFLKLGAMADTAKWEWTAAGSPDGPVPVPGTDETMEFDAEGRLREQVSATLLAHLWGDRMRWCIELFGPQRCLFESNFPPNRRLASWQSTWEAFDLIAAHLPDEARRRLFSETAVHLYGL